MKELETLSKQIMDRVKQEGTQKVMEQEKILSQKLEENRLRLVGQHKTQKKLIESRSKDDYERQVQSLKNAKRNRILSEKQNVLSAIFDDAVKKMEAWDSATFQTFVKDVLSQFDTEQITVVPGEKSAFHFTDAFIQSLKTSKPTLKVEKESIKNQSGFLVGIGGVDYNFFFDQMIAEIKKEFSPKLASLAFQKDE